MSKFFVPYLENNPAAIDIKGHRLLIVSKSEDEMLSELETIGGSELIEMSLPDDVEKSEIILSSLAEKIDGGVVLNPPGMSVSDLIQSLHEELPWIH